MEIGSAIILGLVQGLAEFLPISSSGHLSVLQNLFHMNTLEEGHLFFDVLLHLGTLVSIFICYWSDIADMVREVFIVLRGGRNAAENKPAIQDAEKRVIETALRHGIQPRCEIQTPEEAQYYIDLGVRHFSLGDQFKVLKKFWDEQGKRIRDIADGLDGR